MSAVLQYIYIYIKGLFKDDLKKLKQPMNIGVRGAEIN